MGSFNHLIQPAHRSPSFTYLPTKWAK